LNEEEEEEADKNHTSQQQQQTSSSTNSNLKFPLADGKVLKSSELEKETGKNFLIQIWVQKPSSEGFLL